MGTRDRMEFLRDAAAGLALLLLSQIPVLRPAGERIGAGTVLGLALVSAVAVFVRRWRPVAACVGALAVAGVALVVGVGPVFFLAAAYLLYGVAARPGPGSRGPVSVVVGVCAAGAVTLTVAGSQHTPGGNSFVQLLCGVLVLGAAWAAGAAAGERRARALLAVERASERARQDERLRVARDLHDVLTHSVGLIAVKAGVANHVLGSRPEEARAALAVIEDVSRSALRDLRATLAVLRRDPSGTVPCPTERPADRPHGLRPLPGPADLPALVRNAEAAGLEIDLCSRGLGGLPDGVGLSAYRIVQEAVTNVLKHAGPTRCAIRLDAAEEVLRIEVADDGPSPGPREGPIPPGGLGLIGMRERAEAHGGTLTAGPRPEGGFAVRATVPYG
jgi:signal transduction histidine kinase